MDNKDKYSMPNLCSKEKKEREFVDFGLSKKEHKRVKIEIPKKEVMKSVCLRFPEGLYQDMKHLVAVTGISMNAICLEILRPTIKKKLKEIVNEDHYTIDE